MTRRTSVPCVVVRVPSWTLVSFVVNAFSAATCGDAKQSPRPRAIILPIPLHRNSVSRHHNPLEETMAHELPPLPYAYEALEPTIDKQTMTLHHDMHHGAYVKNLNAAIEKHPNLSSKSAEDLLRDLNAIPEHIRAAVRNNGGGKAR